MSLPQPAYILVFEPMPNMQCGGEPTPARLLVKVVLLIVKVVVYAILFWSFTSIAPPSLSARLLRNTQSATINVADEWTKTVSLLLASVYTVSAAAPCPVRRAASSNVSIKVM